MDRVGYSAGQLLNPRPPACKAGDLPLIYRPDLQEHRLNLALDGVNIRGGDPSAGSPTDTLLRLSPAR